MNNNTQQDRSYEERTESFGMDRKTSMINQQFHHNRNMCYN